MINNKSQTTVFIILAIIVFVVIAIFLIVTNSGNNGPIHFFKSQVDEIKDGIIQCEKENARDGVKRIGIQGGYFNKPQYSDDLGWAFIPYYYYKGDILIPNKSVIENELSAYVDDKLIYCLQNIPAYDYSLKYDLPKTTTTISPGKIKFVVDLPISIIKGESTNILDLRDDPVEFNSSLYEIYEVSDFITKTHKENDTLFCANCVVEMAKERNLYVDLIEYKDATTLVMLSENHTSKEPYLFEFLNKY